jgi:dipeptidyl aminopeptidase/acylaminoacyl peptidase
MKRFSLLLCQLASAGIVFALGACAGAPGAGGQAAVVQPATPPGGTTHPTPEPEVDAKPDTISGGAAARDAELAKHVTGFVDAFTNSDAHFTRDGKRLVFTSTRDGLPQLYVAGASGGEATRIVATTERVGSVLVPPGGKDVIFTADKGADELWSVFRVGLDGKGLVELTPGERLNRDRVIVPDGKPSTMFFSGRKMAEARSTVFSASAVSASEPKAVWTSERPGFLVDVTPDGKAGLYLDYPSRTENYVVRVDLESGKAKPLWPTGADRKVTIFGVAWSRDARRAYVATDNGEEAAYVLALDAATGKELGRHVVTPATAMVVNLAVAKEGNAVALSLVVGDHAEVRVIDGRTMKARATAKLPLGTGWASDFSEDGKRLAVSWSTPQTPGDIFAVDPTTGAVTALRNEPRPSLGGAAPAMEVSVTSVPAFDGGAIPVNVYLPAKRGGAKLPVIAVFHGGPSGVSVVRWNPMIASFVALGYAVVEPNVRGSSGFGRAYEAGDNGPKRLDAFKDIESSARWIAAQPWADPKRMVVYGASYGGYTTLVALSRWPELWRAGVDAFGVVNLKTFMATTSGAIRQLFLVEFGDPDKDAAFLAQISPITDVDKIKAPTFVYAGANDPRVPKSESDLIVKALRKRGVPVEYIVAANEGHSLSRRESQIEFWSRMARFLEAHAK